MGILRRSSWNDDRLDEFSRRTDDRLDELSRRTDEGFKEMRQGFAAINQRFDRLTNTLMVVGGGAFLAFLGKVFFG